MSFLWLTNSSTKVTKRTFYLPTGKLKVEVEEKMLEIKKAIPGFKGYEISTWGRVYKNGKQVKPEVHCKGYLRVDLFNDNGRKHYKVHRLVAEAFIPNPDGKPCVNHIDGNNQNNSVTNLEWVTNKENVDHAVRIRHGNKW